jgi:uncharacterized protein
VTDHTDIRHLEHIPLTPWAPGKHDHFIRISPAIVNGRRVHAGQADGSQ